MQHEVNHWLFVVLHAMHHFCGSMAAVLSNLLTGCTGYINEKAGTNSTLFYCAYAVACSAMSSKAIRSGILLLGLFFVLVNCEEPKIWALLAAGSTGWRNYRHQVLNQMFE